jgi:hypothetical protein
MASFEDVVERHAHRIGDRLVLVFEEARQIVEHRAVVDHLVMIGADLFGDTARVLEFVQGYRSVGEAHRERC